MLSRHFIIKWSVTYKISESNRLVRQRENFLILMENYNQILEAQAIASDSAGLATERYDIYMDGLEATTNRFTAALEQMWMKSIDSDFIKWFIDLGTSVLTLTNNIGGLVPMLAAFLGAITLIKYQELSSFIVKVGAGIIDLVAKIKGSSIAISLFAKMTATQLVIATAGLTLLIGAVVAMGVTFYNNIDKTKKYIESLDELNSSISSLDSTIESSLKSITAIKELGSEFERLDSIVGRNAEQQEEWLEIQRELKNLIPEINGYYNETGNFLFDEGVNLEKLNGLMIERIRLLNEEREIDRQERLKVEIDLLEEQEKTLERAIKKRNNYAKMQEKWAGVGFTIGGGEGSIIDSVEIDEESMIANYDVKLDELDDAVETARREVEKTTNSIGFMELGQDDLADATEDTIPPLRDQVAILKELSEAADEARNAFVSSANSAKSLIESYDEHDAISLSQVEQLRKEFPEEYTQALYLEGNQIRLNTEVLKELVLARAIASVENQKQTIAAIGLGIQEAEASIVVAETIVSANKTTIMAQHTLSEAYYWTAVAATNSANDQIAATNAILKALGEDLSSAQASLAISEAYVNQLKDGSFWANELADSTSGVGGLTEGQKAYNDLLAITIKMLKQKKKDEKDALKEQLDGYKKIIDAQKKLIDLKEEERDYNNELGDKNKELANIDAELLQIQFDNSEWATARRLELEDEKADKIEEIGEFQNDRSVELQKDALDEEYDQYKEFIDKKIKVIDDYLEKAGLIAQDAINLMQNRTDGFYQSLISWNRMYGDSIDNTIVKLWNLADATQAASFFGSGGIGVPRSAPAPEAERDSQSKYNEFVIGGIPNYIHKDTGQSISMQDYNNLPKYHEGGLIGGLPGVQAGEIFAKLMKGEAVVTQQQMQRFMNNTLPNLATTAGDDKMVVHMPITVHGNLDKTVLPELKSMVMDIMVQTSSNRGIKRTAKSFSI